MGVGPSHSGAYRHRQQLLLAASRADLFRIASIVREQPGLFPGQRHQNKRDACFAEAADCALLCKNYTAGQEVFKILVLNISNKTVRDGCCTRAAEGAMKLRQWNFIVFLAQSISDRRLSDEICLKAAELSIRDGECDTVRFLVQSITDQTCRDKCCIEAAKYAIVANINENDFILFLIQSIASQHSRDTCCVHVAEIAAKAGHWEIVDSLVQQIADQSSKDICYLKFLKLIASSRCADGVKFLNRRGENIPAHCFVSATESAVESDNLEAVSFLLQAAKYPSQTHNQCCIKAAEIAAKKRYWEILAVVVQAIADPATRDQFCVSNAISEAKNCNWDALKFYMQAIVEPGVRNHCCIRTVEFAVERRRLDVLEFLLQFVGDARLRAECSHRIVVSAAGCGDSSIVDAIGIQPEWLLENNKSLLDFFSNKTILGDPVDTLIRVVSEMQPDQAAQLLCICITAGHVALSLVLMPHVANVNLPDASESTAIMLAADAGHHELITELLGRRASVRAADSQGRTALTRACQAGHVRAAKVLFDHGADVDHVDNNGMSCTQLADRSGHAEIMQLFQHVGFVRTDESLYGLAPSTRQHSDDRNHDAQCSIWLHQLLNLAGFTQQRARCQQAIADFLQSMARVLAQDNRKMTGSYSEGWANSLLQVNGRTAADSDIDWTVMIFRQPFVLAHGAATADNHSYDNAVRLVVNEGHAQVVLGSGSQPAVTASACGVRPAQDTCHAFECCGTFCREQVRLLTDYIRPVHLVRATRPNMANELRVSFSFQEKAIIRGLSTIQGQLFVVIKFIFKRYLPHVRGTTGLKTYHAKTLLLFMLKEYTYDEGTHGSNPWQPQNLITLLKESLDKMLRFIDASKSPDECMPHFFIKDAPLYFKNAGIGGHFQYTQSRVCNGLSELRSDLRDAMEQIRSHVRPLKSENFYFHPFTLLPLIPLSAAFEVRQEHPEHFADAFSVVHKCLIDLQSETVDKVVMMQQLSLLKQLQWCKCAVLCLTLMAHLKLGEIAAAKRVARDLREHHCQDGWGLKAFQFNLQNGKSAQRNWTCPVDSDWAWRFCLSCNSQPHFPFLPRFTQTLLTTRLSVPRSSHMYVNFRCLSWSLQAELLSSHTTRATFAAWYNELQQDPDLEELLTLAHYSDCREHIQFCLTTMKTLRDERRVVMETRDEEKINWVSGKLAELNMGRLLEKDVLWV